MAVGESSFVGGVASAFTIFDAAGFGVAFLGSALTEASSFFFNFLRASAS